MPAPASNDRERIAVLGGGLLGCCLSLALAQRGASVVLFERHPQLLLGAATSNEGKIHLGYVYALDSELRTARIMIRGALQFFTLIERYLGGSSSAFQISDPFIYAVHRASMLSDHEVEAYLHRVHGELSDATDGKRGLLPWDDPTAPPRRLELRELESRFASDRVAAAFTTSEIAIDPDLLAACLRWRIMEDPRIEVRTDHTVSSVSDTRRGLDVVTESDGACDRDEFDQVVNALWDGRLNLDAERGVAPTRPWIYRRKYGIRFSRPNSSPELPTVTFVLGPFGDIVSYRNGLFYASWYPCGMTATSTGLQAPPEPAGREDAQWRKELVSQTLQCLGRIAHSISELATEDQFDAQVRGGVIVAWGDRDISDPQSELHQRWEIGIHSHGRYHSVDPGKLSMAPYFAECCAKRLLGS